MKGSFEAYNDLEQALSLCGEYVTQVSGNSMYPMLRYRRDPVLIHPVKGELNRYDVAVYDRGDGYVIHRILEVRSDCYVFRGDNCTFKEMVPKQLVLGVVNGFWRIGRNGGAGHFVSVQNGIYRLYSRVWVALNPVDVKCLRLISYAKHIIRRLFNFNNNRNEQ